jgi:hypothetical protein
MQDSVKIETYLNTSDLGGALYKNFHSVTVNTRALPKGKEKSDSI